MCGMMMDCPSRRWSRQNVRSRVMLEPMLEEVVPAWHQLAWQWLRGEDGGDRHIDFRDDPFLWTCYLVIIVLLVCVAGLMSGLTLGLMSLDQVELEVRAWCLAWGMHDMHVWQSLRVHVTWQASNTVVHLSTRTICIDC